MGPFLTFIIFICIGTNWRLGENYELSSCDPHFDQSFQVQN